MKHFSSLAKWISIYDDIARLSDTAPSLRLRKVFEVKELGSATCLICGLGYYTLYINGLKVSDDVLSPAFTAYDKRALFVRHDITNYLHVGKNVITVTLGNGHYNQTTKDEWNFYTASWRNIPRLLLELFVGENSVCASDTSWRCSLNGPITHNALRTGEYYDATKEDGWEDIDYDDGDWQFASIVRPCGGILEEQTMPLIKEQNTLTAVRKWKSKNGWIFDFGKNIAGYVGIAMQGERGKTLRIRYAEKLKGNELDQSNIDFYVETNAFSEDRYTFKGEGIECWKPAFVYHGFQYVELLWEEEPSLPAITAYHVYTDLSQKGSFASSDNLLNWIFDAGIRSFLNNYHSIPEDCPHREKNGWTGDAWLSSGYATFYFDMIESYKKWLQDIMDTQRINGQLCCIAPTSGWGYNWGSGPSFDFAVFAIPYAIYLETGDTSCIRLVYPYLKNYFEFLETFIENNLLCFGLGDWRPPDNVDDLKVIDNRLLDSCFYFSMLRIYAKMADLLQEQEVAVQAIISAEKVRQAIKTRYISTEKLNDYGQSSLAFLLYFHIVKDEEAYVIARQLAELVKTDSYRFKTGIFGTITVLNALSEYGYTDVAYKMVARSDYPSYGYWKEQGATTLWESWLGDASRNHHMFGDVIDWMTRYIVGIQNAGVSYNQCLLKPYFFEDNCSAKAETNTPTGRVSFSWVKNGNSFKATIEIPKNSKAWLVLPNKEPIEIKHGINHFETII